MKPGLSSGKEEIALLVEEKQNLEQDLDSILERVKETGEDNLNQAQINEFISNIFGQFRSIVLEKRKRKEYTYAYNAFTSAVLNGPANALTKDYEPAKTFWEFLWDLCNRKTLPKIVIATLVGGLAAYFFVPSAIGAASMMAEVFGISDELVKAGMGYFMAAVGSGENAALGAFSMKDMIELWFEEESDERYYLNGKSDATKLEKGLKKGKTIADTMLAAGPVVASFAMALQGGNFWLALASAIACYGPNWLGVAKFNYAPNPPKTIKQIYMGKAKETIANYIEDQINNFLSLPVNEIFSKLGQMTGDYAVAANDLDNEESYFARAFTDILNLSEPAKNIDDLHILPKKQESFSRKCFRNAVTFSTTISVSGYIVEAYKGGSTFWKDHPNVTGLPPALLSILPFIGLSYVSGVNVGTHAGAGENTLADIAYPKIMRFFNYAIPIISIGSGGTNFKVNVDNISIPGFPDYFNKILAYSMGALGFVGAPVANGYYTLKLLDDIVTIYAKECADEPTRKLINYILKLRELQATIKDTTDAKFSELFSDIYHKHPDISHHLLKIMQDRNNCGDIKGFLDRLDDKAAGQSMAGKLNLNYAYTALAGDGKKTKSVFFKDTCGGMRQRKINGHGENNALLSDDKNNLPTYHTLEM